MTVLDVRDSQVLKTDPYFQLQRVITRSGDEFLVKLATDDRGNEDKLLEREFELLRSIGPDHGLTSLRLARLGGRLAAIYEPFDGLPLAPPKAAGALDLQEFSEVAGDICAILAVLHGRGSILLGVSPSSFLRSPRTRRLLWQTLRSRRCRDRRSTGARSTGSRAPTSPTPHRR